MPQEVKDGLQIVHVRYEFPACSLYFFIFFRLFSAEKRCMMLDIVYFDCLSKSGFELVRHISRFFGVIATHTLLGQGQEAQAPRQADK